MCKCRPDMERLERAGFAAHRAAQDLREVRERYPSGDDLARRLLAIEEEARTVAGEMAMRLREIEEAEDFGPPSVRLAI